MSAKYIDGRRNEWSVLRLFSKKMFQNDNILQNNYLFGELSGYEQNEMNLDGSFLAQSLCQNI